MGRPIYSVASIKFDIQPIVEMRRRVDAIVECNPSALCNNNNNNNPVEQLLRLALFIDAILYVEYTQPENLVSRK